MIGDNTILFVLSLSLLMSFTVIELKDVLTKISEV